MTPAPCAVLINPTDGEAPLIKTMFQAGGKVLLLGRLGRRVADLLGIDIPQDGWIDPAWSQVKVDETQPFNVSRAAIRYATDHSLGAAAVVGARPLARYHFADEWNNLGYGHILCDAGPWSVATLAVCGDSTLIAHIEDHDGTMLSAYKLSWRISPREPHYGSIGRSDRSTASSGAS